MENKDIIQDAEDTQKKPCQGECKKENADANQKCNDWNWSNVKDMLMCWNDCGKDSGQDSYNMISMICMVVIAACVLFISFSVMNISQNLDKMAGIEKYINELN